MIPSSEARLCYAEVSDCLGLQLAPPSGGGHRRRQSREGDLASSLLAATQEHLDQYAREGLRTLLLASRTLTLEEHAAWAHKYHAASTSMVGRARALAELAAETEVGLTLLGATGIEDKLQEGVPETIALLRRGGLKVWVLTGDKQETAVSIAFSCQLLTDDMTPVVICDMPSKEACGAALAKAAAQYLGGAEGHGLKGKRAQRRSTDGGGQYQTVERDRVTQLRQSSSSSGAAGVSASERVQRWGGQGGGVANGEASTAGAGPRQLALVIDGHSLQHALSEELEEQVRAAAGPTRATARHAAGNIFFGSGCMSTGRSAD
jgi:phospholipid-transporting ATPase